MHRDAGADGGAGVSEVDGMARVSTIVGRAWHGVLVIVVVAP